MSSNSVTASDAARLDVGDTGEQIRILRMIARLNVGGPALNACFLTAHLAPDKFRSWLMCGRPQKNEREDDELIRRLRLKPLYVDEFTRNLRLGDVQAFRKLRAAVKAI